MVFLLITQVMRAKLVLNQPQLNQHPPVHHPLDACYYSVVDEPHLS